MDKEGIHDNPEETPTCDGNSTSTRGSGSQAPLGGLMGATFVLGEGGAKYTKNRLSVTKLGSMKGGEQG